MIQNSYKRLLMISILATIVSTSITGQSFAGYKEDYEAALATFRSAKEKADYQLAVDQFFTLAKRSDGGSLKANTLFWLAESYYGLKEYGQALNTFERVLLIPRSNKEEDSRYKVAACYLRLGQVELARWEFTRFLRDFPSSSKVDLVRKELNKLPQ